ncbi:hypothetical protein C8F01DRAFT_1075663 [Mycena amicta]|nr:hypothetical protein C8F01DRAFT_1075663 [Mycena amicta]
MDLEDGGLREQALHHLEAVAWRWEYVMLFLPHNFNDPNAFRQRLKGSMPLLLELDLRFDEESPLNTLFGSLDAPRMHTAFLDFRAVRSQQLLHELPWTQLTQLNLRNIETSKAAIILRETTNLVHCQLWMMDGDAGGDSELHLPRLETLIVFTAIIFSEGVYDLLLSLRTLGLQRFGIEDAYTQRDHEHLRLAAVINALGSYPNREESLEGYQTALPEVARIEFANTFSNEDWGSWDLLKSTLNLIPSLSLSLLEGIIQGPRQSFSCAIPGTKILSAGGS